MPRRSDADGTSGIDTASRTTVHAHPTGWSSPAPAENEGVRLNFSNDLQRSRVYRRNPAFCESAISEITNSVYSLRWSIFSGLSLSEVSNISVINLAVTDRETFNPTRSTQTWSVQSNHGASTGPDTYEHRDGQRAPSLEVVRELFSAITSATSHESSPAFPQTEQQSFPDARSLTPLLPPVYRYVDLNLDPVSQMMPDPSSGSRVAPVDVAWHCNGCGEVRKAQPVVGRIANVYGLDLDTRGRKDRRTWYVFTTKMTTLQSRCTNSPPAGNRWHINCLDCNTCGSIFDEDLIILLQRDGSLICDYCLYNCSVCDTKIEDLAVLARDDEGYCAIRFKCQSCEKKIEDLNYARLSQGLFCKACHESLTQRRRRKTRKAYAKNKQRERALPKAPKIVQLGVDERLSMLAPPEIPVQRGTVARTGTLATAPRYLITPSEAPFGFF